MKKRRALLPRNYLKFPLVKVIVSKIAYSQVAQNRVKVATDGSFCEDTTFVQPLLKIFLFTLRLRSRYLKGTPELAL